MSIERLLELADELGCTIEVAGRYTGVEDGYLTSEPIDGCRITTPGWFEGDEFPPPPAQGEGPALRHVVDRLTEQGR